MIYLGMLGQMVGIKCPASQQVTPEDPLSFVTTVEGRVKAQRRPVARRSWSLATSEATSPDEQATLVDFANGAWGRGPWWFVSADAPVTNMLTPAAASCDPDVLVPTTGAELLGTPPVEYAPGRWAPRSVWKNTANTVVIGGRVPVPAGGRVTASAWVQNGAVRIEFFNAAGTFVQQNDSVSATSMRRVHTTVAVPVGAVSARLLATAPATRLTRPALTWTDRLMEYSDGQGCEKAVVHAMSRDQIWAGRSPSQQMSQLGFTVTEVG